MHLAAAHLGLFRDSQIGCMRLSLVAALIATTVATTIEVTATGETVETESLQRQNSGSSPLDKLEAHAWTLARQGHFDEAGHAFERAAALAPSMGRLTRHRQHNMELVAGKQRSPQVEELPGGNDDGGWGGEHDSLAQCDIDTRLDLSREEFAERYVLGGRPVLLPLQAVAHMNNVVGKHSAAPDDFWDRDELVRQLGDCIVPVVSTSGVVDHQYGNRRGVRLTRHLSLKAYIRTELQPLPNEECLDAGPWPCDEDGCPANPLGCAELASLGLCEHRFDEVWDAPPAGLTNHARVVHRCPVVCGACSPQKAGESGEVASTRRRASDDAALPQEHIAAGSDAAGADAPYVVFTRPPQRGPSSQQPSSQQPSSQQPSSQQPSSQQTSLQQTSSQARGPSGLTTKSAMEELERVCWAGIDAHMQLANLGNLSSLFLDEASHKRILFIGGSGSGTFFHDHSNAFNIMPYGRKRWLLLPPSGTYELRGEGVADGAADGGRRLPLEWLRSYDADPTKLPISPLRCVQPAGTALFVPSGWMHAVINDAPSIAVAVEVGDTDVIRRASSTAAPG